MALYGVYVSNIGPVYCGHSYAKAKAAFEEYKRQLHEHYGRASQESVIMFSDGEIVRKFIGDIDKQEGGEQ